METRGYNRPRALLAQLVEHLHGKEGVDGSSPSEGFEKPLQIGACAIAIVACDGDKGRHQVAHRPQNG